MATLSLEGGAQEGRLPIGLPGVRPGEYSRRICGLSSLSPDPEVLTAVFEQLVSRNLRLLAILGSNAGAGDPDFLAAHINRARLGTMTNVVARVNASVAGSLLIALCFLIPEKDQISGR